MKVERGEVAREEELEQNLYFSPKDFHELGRALARRTVRPEYLKRKMERGEVAREGELEQNWFQSEGLP